MQLRLIIAVGLLLVVSGLGIFLYLTRPGTDSGIETVQLTDLAAEDISRISITRSTGNRINFTRQDGIWYMQEPYHLAANPLRMHGILGLASAYSYTQLDAGSLELQRLQLDPPNLIVYLNDIEIQFGDASPLGKQRYVLLGQTVHLINDSLYLQLQAPATFFLDTRLLPADADIQSIQYKDYRMVKTGDDWQISPPLENEQPDINAIVTAWQTAEALSVREYEMEADTETVTVQMKDHPPVTFNIAVTDSGMILGRQDLQLQYHLSRYDYQQMFINTTPGMAASPVE